MIYDPESHKVPEGMIFAGGCGVNVGSELARSLDPDDHPDLQLMFMNTDGPHLDHLLTKKAQTNEILRKWMEREGDGRFKKLAIGKTFMGAGGFPKVAREAAEDQCSAIENFMRRLECVVFVGAGGGGTGSGVLPVLAQTAERLQKRAFSIFIVPASVEGDERKEISQAALKATQAACPTFVYYNDQIPNQDRDVDVVYSELNRDGVVKLMLELQCITQEVGEISNADLNDVGRLLAFGNSLHIGTSKYRETDDIKEVAKNLFTNVYQDKGIVLRAKEFIMRRGKGIYGRHLELLREMTKLSQRKDGINVKCWIGSEPSEDISIIAAAKGPSQEEVVSVTAVAAMEKQDLANKANGKGELVRIRCMIRNRMVEILVPPDVQKRWNWVNTLTPSRANKQEVRQAIAVIKPFAKEEVDFPGGYDAIPD